MHNITNNLEHEYQVGGVVTVDDVLLDIIDDGIDKLVIIAACDGLSV